MSFTHCNFLGDLELDKKETGSDITITERSLFIFSGPEEQDKNIITNKIVNIFIFIITLKFF